MSKKESIKIGWIGLGLMGSRMCSRILNAGYPIFIWNRTEVKAKPLLEKGARWENTPRDVAIKSDFIFTMVSDPDAIENVLTGESGILNGIKDGKILIDMSTVGPQKSRWIDRKIRQKDGIFIDAPVLGSISHVERGELLIFAGGDEKIIERVKPLLLLLGKEIFHAGGIGQGSAMKLTTNLLLGRMMEVLGEVLLFGKELGLSPDLILRILDVSAISSPFWKRGESLLKEEPPLHFPLKHMLKDLKLISETASENNIALPVNTAVEKVFEKAYNSGLGEKDYSSLVRWMLFKEKEVRIQK